MISLLALLAGFLLDLLIGDPHFLYHPVRLVGALISFLEKVIRKIFPGKRKKASWPAALSWQSLLWP